MPWDIVHNHPACRAGEWAVVNRTADQEGRHSIEGCHHTRDEALAQQRALYAKEPQMHSLTAPVEWKAITGDPGTLEGYLSVFGNVDIGGDVVMPGAFKKTLADWRASKRRIPLLVDHKMSTEGVVGSIPWAEEDSKGVRIRAQFSSIAKAQDIRTLMLEGHLNGMSFTYEAVRSRPGRVEGKNVRFLDEVRLFEGTITPFPMNVLAVGTAKSEQKDPPQLPQQMAGQGLDFETFSDAMRKALELPAFARKAAVDLILAAYQPTTETEAAGPADEPPTADAAVTTDLAPEPGPAGDTAAYPDGPANYALALIASPGPRDGAPDSKPPASAGASTSRALADPLIPLEVARQNAEADRLEREINQALGRAAG